MNFEKNILLVNAHVYIIYSGASLRWHKDGKDSPLEGTQLLDSKYYMYVHTLDCLH